MSGAPNNSKTLNNAASDAAAHVDHASTVAHATVSPPNNAPVAPSTATHALNQSATLAKKATENHHALAAHVAANAKASGDASTAKKAVQSSKDVTAHSKATATAAHGMNWEAILAIVIAIICALMGLYLLM